MIKYKHEYITPDVIALAEENGKEWEQYASGAMGFNLDVSQMLEAERNGLLNTITARDDSVLVGYCIFVSAHNHAFNINVKDAQCVALYVTKKYRKSLIGYFLLKKAIEYSRKIGVTYFSMGVKIDQPLGPIMKRLGLSPIETRYAGRI